VNPRRIGRVLPTNAMSAMSRCRKPRASWPTSTNWIRHDGRYQDDDAEVDAQIERADSFIEQLQGFICLLLW
jgi:hypothetical protein